MKVRFVVLTVANMEMTVLWDVAACSLIETDDVSEVLTVSIIKSVDQFKQDYTAQDPRRQSS
jgi:hypothetical protein